MNKLHQQILAVMKKEADKDPFKSKHNNSYSGHSEESYPISNPQLRKITKKFLKENNLNYNQFINFLNSLYKNSKTSTEKCTAGYIIEYCPKLRKQINPQVLEQWLNYLEGWAQVDSLCQSKFAPDDLLVDWPAWKKLLKNLNKDDNINKRRASLVILTAPVRKSEDKRFRQLAFENIENLKNEKDKLITKAISWLLREMTKLHPEKVAKYLEKSKGSLPSIAVRETKNKLETGKK